MYTNKSPELENEIATKLGEFLNKSYDAVLLWETPVPFLEQMFPDAVIIHQMPGAFSRPPYPHTVVFDPVGLYRKGILHKYATEIQKGDAVNDNNCQLAKRFCNEVKFSITQLQPIDTSKNPIHLENKKTNLLPLQVSSHYAFACDNNYDDQFEFLLDVLKNKSEDTRLLATQYISAHTKDTPINEDVSKSIKNKFPDFIYHQDFDKIGSVSQYLLPLVDGVITASSSIGIQAMAWHGKRI